MARANVYGSRVVLLPLAADTALSKLESRHPVVKSENAVVTVKADQAPLALPMVRVIALVNPHSHNRSRLIHRPTMWPKRYSPAQKMRKARSLILRA
jgi:hypothetical protein